MTAAVPDPRFRDQLAEALDGWFEEWWPAAAPLPRQRLAAEVEARVQAAANQRTAEVRCTRGHLESEHWQDGYYSCPAALASPAPAPRAEAGR